MLLWCLHKQWTLGGCSSVSSSDPWPPVESGGWLNTSFLNTKKDNKKKNIRRLLGFSLPHYRQWTRYVLYILYSTFYRSMFEQYPLHFPFLLHTLLIFNFIQHNRLRHAARLTEEFEANLLYVLHWTSQSPDHDPTEQAINLLKSRLIKQVNLQSNMKVSIWMSF